MSSIPGEARYTYEDYKKFPDELRCEIIDGQVYDMTPAPSIKHQEVALQTAHLIRNFLANQNHPCRVFIAPTDVVLAEDQVVQPDLPVYAIGAKSPRQPYLAPPMLSSRSSPQGRN